MATGHNIYINIGLLAKMLISVHPYLVFLFWCLQCSSSFYQSSMLRLCPLCDRRHGLLGLYKGLEAKLLQTVLTAALMFVVYEKITAATFKLMGLQKKLKHWDTVGPHHRATCTNEWLPLTHTLKRSFTYPISHCSACMG